MESNSNCSQGILLFAATAFAVYSMSHVHPTPIHSEAVNNVVDEPEDYDDIDTRSMRELQDAVLKACHDTAKSFRDSVAERHIRVMMLRELRSSLAQSHENLSRTITADPELARCRFDNAGLDIPDGFTPLHVAASKGNLIQLRMLLECREAAPPSAENGAEAATGESEAAAAEARPAIVPAVSAWTVDLQGRTPLHVAVANGQVEAARILREAMAAEGRRKGDSVVFVDPVGKDAPIDLCGCTPLGWAGKHTPLFLPQNQPAASEPVAETPTATPITPAKESADVTAANPSATTPAAALSTPQRPPLNAATTPSPMRTGVASPAGGCGKRVSSSSSLLRLGDRTVLPQSPLGKRAGNRSNLTSPAASAGTATFAATAGVPSTVSPSLFHSPTRSATAISAAGGRVLLFGHSEATGWRPYMEDRVIVPTARGGTSDAGSLLYTTEPKAHAPGSGSNVGTLPQAIRRQLGRTFLFGVCDGHGGDYAVNFLQRKLPEFVRQALVEKLMHVGAAADARLRDDELRATMKLAVMRADEELSRHGRMQPQVTSKGKISFLDTSGSTAVLSLVTDEALCIAHVGDSRAVVVTVKAPRCGNASAVVVRHATADHKATLAAEQERIRAAGAVVNEETGEVSLESAPSSASVTLCMSRAIGDFYLKRNPLMTPEQQAIIAVPDVVVLPRSQTDDGFVILACDGVWDVMTNEEAAAFVYERLCAATDAAVARSQAGQYQSPQIGAAAGEALFDASVLPEVADALIHHCVETLGAQDNLSVVLLLLNTPQRLGLTASVGAGGVRKKLL